MTLADIIEHYLRALVEESDSTTVEIVRSNLAEQFSCVPSQINYVLTTRFTPERGFLVESRRGGGGGIRITQIPMNTTNNYLMHLLNSMDTELSEQKASLYLKELQLNKLISRREAILFESLMSNKVFYEISVKERLILRSRMMKNMIACLTGQIGGGEL